MKLKYNEKYGNFIFDTSVQITDDLELMKTLSEDNVREYIGSKWFVKLLHRDLLSEE